jgi:Lipocalin-like domain
MYRRSIFRFCGLVAAGLLALNSSAAAQTEQKPAKDLISGSWTLMIADNVRSDGNKVPGFGPLPKGTAKFGSDGRYSLEVMPNSSIHATLSYSGSYALDDSGKTLTLRVEESSLPNWRGTTQTGAVKFLAGDHLGWTNSVSLVASEDFVGTELIWARAK